MPCDCFMAMVGWDSQSILLTLPALLLKALQDCPWLPSMFLAEMVALLCALVQRAIIICVLLALEPEAGEGGPKWRESVMPLFSDTT